MILSRHESTKGGLGRLRPDPKDTRTIGGTPSYYCEAQNSGRFGKSTEREEIEKKGHSLSCLGYRKRLQPGGSNGRIQKKKKKTKDDGYLAPAYSLSQVPWGKGEGKAGGGTLALPYPTFPNSLEIKLCNLGRESGYCAAGRLTT